MPEMQASLPPDPNHPRRPAGSPRGPGRAGRRKELVATAAAVLVSTSVAACGGADAEAGRAETPEEPQETVVSRVPASQPGSVMQRIAEAEITVTYSRPVARGRELFGNLVDYGELWNPGADHATYLTTTADIELGGQPLPAGSYSIWARPDPEAWTLFFHEDWDVFHMPFPGEEGIALEVGAEPTTATHMETMAFYFPVADGREGVLSLHWGETRVDIPIRVPGAGGQGG